MSEQRARFSRGVGAAGVDQRFELPETIHPAIPLSRAPQSPTGRKVPNPKEKVMTGSREQESLARVLAHEGGYSNHPADPGDATMKGVTQRIYDAYRRSKKLALRSVKSITSQELFEIYDRQYWDTVKGGLLPAGVDYVVFDGAANSGPKQSILWLQRALGPLYRAPSLPSRPATTTMP
ncbi:glycosyl hydrolase 108 family protein [Mesorhizobium sp. M1A.F.Ca.ET.072.01.1.1]|uniref:glycoside hydrolase family 108 protein n=1 Tax=Mesorhizobium sp. M1A.F.Ca.ET.072.01.1.1 TaxID=2496753 RepID=UPI001FE23DD7|nr:glycosyl hydrolase 108 family protein [Mesorhizobium sp. M1A.F.Ca.ET.072.01.1.1]